MQQTILALAAVITFSLYALTRHESDASRERIAITTEVESAAAGIARARMHEVSTREYDEADIALDRARQSTIGLTPARALGPEAGETTEASYDDLDDFHTEAQTITVQRNGRDLVFRDSVSVRYVVPETAEPVSRPTLAKEVTVTVTAAPAGFIGRGEIAARLRRIVTPASAHTHSTN